METGPVYLDFAATTPVRREVMQAMSPYFSDVFGNPSSLYLLGEEARNGVAVAREQVAKAINSIPSEITFTSGGTESNNAALKGSAMALGEIGKRIVISAIEHPSVKQVAEQLGRWGWSVDVLPVDSEGRVDPNAVYEAIKPDTTVVSVMMVNNEVGTIQDIAAISAKVQERASELGHTVVLHTDAVQAMGKLPVDVKELGVDLLSLSAHKVYGPKGAGALYVRRGTPFEPLHVGGGQERQRRAGTENVVAIVGMGKALELAVKDRDEFMARAKELSEQLKQGIEKLFPSAVFNAYSQYRIPSILNVSFPGVMGEVMLINLDFEEISTSSGSACSSASIEPSETLVALGQNADLAVSGIRFSLGITTTKADIDTVLEKFPAILKKVLPDQPHKIPA